MKSILSGPAGGVVGYALTSWDAEEKAPIIGFDVGGTSTDVSRFAGRYESVAETTTAGISINVPQLEINTVRTRGLGRDTQTCEQLLICGGRSQRAVVAV